MQTHSASKHFFYISFKICCWYPEGQKGSLSHASLSKRNPVPNSTRQQRLRHISAARALMVVMGTLILAPHCTWQKSACNNKSERTQTPRRFCGAVWSAAQPTGMSDAMVSGLVPLRQLIKLETHFSLVYTGRRRWGHRWQHNWTMTKMQREIFSLMHPMPARNKENFHCYLLIFILEFTIGSLLLEKFYNN